MESSRPPESEVLEDEPGKESWEWIKAISIALALVIIIRWLLFSPYQVSGPSMEPNFFNGERLIVNKIVYQLREPHRGEVVIFDAPEGKKYIKRVIALSGETVELRGDELFINGERYREPYLEETIANANAQGRVYNFGKDFDIQTVPENSFFVLGDNRPNSRDSRDIGFVNVDNLVGRADIIYWPFKELSFIQHEDQFEILTTR